MEKENVKVVKKIKKAKITVILATKRWLVLVLVQHNFENTK